MAIGYGAERESIIRKRLRIGALSILVTGGMMTLSGIVYPTINTSSQPLVLERYEEIKRELKKSHGIYFTAGELELRITEPMTLADKLIAKLYEIELTPNFAEVREKYKHENEINKDTGLNITLGGIGFALLSSIPLFLSRRKTRKKSSIRNPVL